MAEVKSARERELTDCFVGLDARGRFDESDKKRLDHLFRLAILQGIRIGVEACAHKCWEGNCKGKWTAPEDFRSLKAEEILREQGEE